MKILFKIFCFLGIHDIRVGLGFSGDERYDCCMRCKYYRWVKIKK